MGSSSSIAKCGDDLSSASKCIEPLIIANPLHSHNHSRSSHKQHLISSLSDVSSAETARTVGGMSCNNGMAKSSSAKLLFNALFGCRLIKYIPHIKGHMEFDNVKVWWFPQDFCQSRLGDRVIGSNACTLIDVLLVHRINFNQITIDGHLEGPLSHILISALAESIIDGNEIYETLQKMGELKHPYLTLPEALRYYKWVKDEWQLDDPHSNTKPTVEIKELCNFVETNSTIREKLFDTCHRGIMNWEVQHSSSLETTSNLFIVIIAAERSLLMVYQRHRRQITLIDSHSHQGHGAVVSQTNILDLNLLCNWFDNMCKTWYGCCPTSFEVSFLHYQ
ncbi:hypothetical protein CHUAL_002905 [Chamberlinius hualienensis]